MRRKDLDGKMKKRTLALLLALALLGLTACGGAQAGTEETAPGSAPVEEAVPADPAPTESGADPAPEETVPGESAAVTAPEETTPQESAAVSAPAETQPAVTVPESAAVVEEPVQPADVPSAPPEETVQPEEPAPSESAPAQVAVAETPSVTAPSPEPVPAPEESQAPAEEPAPADPQPATVEDARAFIGQGVDSLTAALGAPLSSSYAPSCLGSGEDGELIYDGFTVYTYREDGVETVEDVL